MATIAAVDIGYRNTKVFAHDTKNGTTREWLFRSIAVPAGASSQTGAGLVRRDTRRVEVDGVPYEVGPDAHLLLGPRSTCVLHEDFIRTQEYRAMFLAALSYIGDHDIDVLVGGLPVRHFDGGKSDLEALMGGSHDVPGLGTVHVRRAMVIPQPMGALIEELSRSGNVTEQTVLLIDPGYFTLDWTAARGLKHLPPLTGSFPAGVSAGLRAVAEHIRQETGRPFDDLNVLDHKIRDGKLMLADLKLGADTLASLMHEGLRPGIVEMKNQIGDGRLVDRVVLCGGGATWFEPLIREAWANLPISVIERPVSANARGFLQLAADMAGLQRGVAA